MPKATAVDVNLNLISDLPTREALLGIVRYINNLASNGLDTDGAVKAKLISLGSGTGIDVMGNLKVASFATLESEKASIGNATRLPSFKTQSYNGSLSTSTTNVMTVPGRVVGSIGWSSIAGSNTNWRPMPSSVSAISAISFNEASTQYNAVAIKNNDGANTNHYNILIFYTD